jgi:hypothetical protein
MCGRDADLTVPARQDDRTLGARTASALLPTEHEAKLRAVICCFLPFLLPQFAIPVEEPGWHEVPRSTFL